MDWKIISKKQLFKGFLSIEEYKITHELYSGGQTEIITRQLMERGHAVAVLLFDPAEDKLVLIEQFRIGAKDDEESSWLIELVAGMIDPGEQAEDVVIRECREEAGVEIKNVRELFTYYSSPGGCSEKIKLYYAEVDSTEAGGIHGLASENEDIKVIVMDFEQAILQMKGGKINSATPILALQWLQLNHDSLISKYK
ncbi:MAG: NUDIX domain-containing protein [Gammaproteobacteria bacterium]|nr:NUDIX domain-containing protein [Gammaproteobacteria bacterium]